MTAPSGRMLLAFKVRKFTPFLWYLMSSVIPTQRNRCFVGSSRSNRVYAHGCNPLYTLKSACVQAFSIALSLSLSLVRLILVYTNLNPFCVDLRRATLRF
jgi:hypothetical protein